MKTLKTKGKKADCGEAKVAQGADVGEYGIKAYGTWNCFKTAAEFKAFLVDWIRNTDGAERDRAVDAYVNLLIGVKKTDTDSGGRP